VGKHSYTGLLMEHEKGLLSRSDGSVVVHLVGDGRKTPIERRADGIALPLVERLSRLRSSHGNNEGGLPTAVDSGSGSGAGSAGLRDTVQRGAMVLVPRRARRRRDWRWARAGGRCHPMAGRQNLLPSPLNSGDLEEDSAWKIHAGFDPFLSTKQILGLDTQLADEEEAMVRSVVAGQMSEETFGTYLQHMPVLPGGGDGGDAVADLQAMLDELATAAGAEEVPLRKSKREWRVFAKDKADITARHFNMLWKAYLEFRRPSPSVPDADAAEQQPRTHKEPWHVAAATLSGKTLCSKLANKRRFDRRARVLATASRRVEEQTSVWDQGLPLPSRNWFRR
jgi:hypothetical protein